MFVCLLTQRGPSGFSFPGKVPSALEPPILSHGRVKLGKQQILWGHSLLQPAQPFPVEPTVLRCCFRVLHNCFEGRTLPYLFVKAWEPVE